MIRPAVSWRLLLPLLLLCLQNLVHAGNSCLQGIVGCTQSMRKRDLTEVSARHQCQAMIDYTSCLGKACTEQPVTCEVQKARREMFEVLASSGIQCDGTHANLEEPEEICSSTSRASPSSPIPSSSSSSLSILLILSSSLMSLSHFHILGFYQYYYI